MFLFVDFALLFRYFYNSPSFFSLSRLSKAELRNAGINLCRGLCKCVWKKVLKKLCRGEDEEEREGWQFIIFLPFLLPFDALSIMADEWEREERTEKSVYLKICHFLWSTMCSSHRFFTRKAFPCLLLINIFGGQKNFCSIFHHEFRHFYSDGGDAASVIVRVLPAIDRKTQKRDDFGESAWRKVLRCAYLMKKKSTCERMEEEIL